MWLLQVILLGLSCPVTSGTCSWMISEWQAWSRCTQSCGGGMQRRDGICVWSKKINQTKTCNNFCLNGGAFTGGRCRCSSWRTGRCCEECREIYIPHCKPGKSECGGSPDNVRCTECVMPYTPAGWGKGCRRLTCQESNGGCEHTCLMERGLAKCACRAGFTLSESSYSCKDINECKTGAANCQHNCTNTVGSFKCSCRSGYSLDSDSYSCSDIDECVTGVAKCDQKCMNTKGSFYCSCNEGFTSSANGLTCIDIDECETHNGGCMQACVNEPGSFHCECKAGYRMTTDHLSCVDIDECTETLSRCSQICDNTPGNYNCSCREGYELQNNGFSCKDIDDCQGVTCSNGGTCLDNIGSFTCSCRKGFTGKYCESDVDECMGFLHGGCEDTCINTVGSFHCECSGNRTLTSDGFSCTGGVKSDSVFRRHGLVRKLLPRGCSTILLTRCTEGNTVDIFMSSTSPWYQLHTNASVIYTFGIVFVEVNTLSLPVSITGLTVVKQNDDFKIVIGMLDLKESEGFTYGEERHLDCISFTTTPKDIHDFLTSLSFLRSFYNSLNKILPDWLSFSQEGTDIMGVNDLHTDLLSGRDIQSGECRGAPLYDGRLYTLLKFGSSFGLSLYGDKVTVPTALRNKQFCLIIDICKDYGGTMFLIMPEESRNILNKFQLFIDLKDKYGIEILPVGLGISLFKHINVQYFATSLQLWNGDEYVNYRVMPEANIWIEGEAMMKYTHSIFAVTVEAKSNVYVSVPPPEDIVKSMFFDEWNVLLKLNLLGSVGIHFRIFGQDHEISLKSIASSDIDVYASLGGMTTRKWCGEYSNPPGIFLSLMVDINPFEKVPLLKHGLLDFNNRVYAFLATDPTTNTRRKDTGVLLDKLFDLRGMVESFTNTTVANVLRYSSLLVGESVELLNDLNHAASDFLRSLEIFFKELSQGKKDSVEHLINSMSTLWTNGLKKIETDTELFLDSIERTTDIAKYNFTTLLKQEVDLIKLNLQNFRDELIKQVFNIFREFQGFGLRYKGNLKVFFLKIVGLEIELVYSINHLGACSRFSEVYNLLKDEHAVRVYAVVSTGLLKLAPFLRMNVGAGIAWVISVDTPGRNIAKLHAEASVLGITVNADVFLTEKGHYFYLEGKVWNAFKASLSVSFETNEVTGLIDTVLVKGTLLANGGDGSSFQDSYCDGMRKLVRKLSDEADKRISQVQIFLTKAQSALTDAQDWLEEKKAKLRNANAAFDAAVQSLEHAKAKLEEAKGPFRNALNKLNEAQRKVDNVCKVRSCKSICVPGIKCRICWKKVWFAKIPLPCCHFTSCMFSFPDPICVAFNLGCRAIRAIAYLALETAKIFVRIPMLALDAAKLLASGAQFVVDKSRVLLDIAAGALDIAKVGLEGAKYILEGQKIALEAIKKVVGWGLKALNYIIQYGVQSIIDARNCGFEIQTSIHDATVFRVVCEINLFRQGFKKVQLGINFGNPIQSIWQAAKGTVDALVDITDQEARQKREVKSRALSGLHQVIRNVRDADMEADDFDVFLNDTIDTVFKTSGFKRNASSADFENRVEIFDEKCSVFTKSFDFYSESIQALFEMVNETANTISNASSIQDDLIGFNINGIVSNFSTESIGINTDAAFTDFNISSEDIEDTIKNAKQNLSNDHLLSDIDNLSKDAAELLQNQTNDANKIRILDQWIAVMENVTFEYFKEDECVSFLDCAHYAIFQFYGLFDAENVTNMTESLDAISLFEDLFLDLTGNLSHTVLEIQDLVNRITENLEALNNFNVFCSKPPSMVSKMANQRVNKGDTLRLICNVTGDPPPNIWWYRNDEYLPEQRDIELVIPNVSETDAQKYHCVAGNLVANLSSERVDVLVEDAPEPDIVSQVTTSETVPETKDITTDDVSIQRQKQKAEESTTSNLTVILGTTLSGVILVIVVGSTIAWRAHLRKKTRKSKAPGSIVSINMVRPDVQKRVFNAREVTDMSVDEF